MNEHNPVVSSAHDARKPWSAPVVAFLSIDETANNATVGNDGAGPTTGS
ncbi:hypothetical protein [Xanthomonas sp. 3498]|nr:hypothetical protein [Xanthomonas sp. 3498]MBB5878167.1 hypothetical protein [Xanthomonas sp. 3498]